MENDHGGRENFLRPLGRALARHLIVPASNLEWLIWGLISACKLAGKKRYDLVYSTDNPVTCRLVAFFLTRLFRISWILYIGDPYSFGPIKELRARWRMKLDRVMDRAFLPHADRIIVNCEETLEGYQNYLHTVPRERYTVITDGYDEAQYKDAEPITSSCFRLVYTGSLYAGCRDLDSLFKAVQILELRDAEIILAGITPPSVLAAAEDAGIRDQVKVMVFQPHQTVVSLQKGASVLLLVGWSAGYQIPGKLFEYFAARRPILAVRHDRLDPGAKLVAQHNRGLVVENDPPSILDSLRTLHHLWREGTLEESFDLRELRQYTWSGLTPAFGDLVGRVIAERRVK